MLLNMIGRIISASKLCPAHSARMRQLVAVTPFGLLLLLLLGLWTGGLQISEGCANPCLGGACCCVLSERLIRCTAGGLLLFPPPSVQSGSNFYKRVLVTASCPRLDVEHLLQLYPGMKTVTFRDSCCPYPQRSKVSDVVLSNYCSDSGKYTVYSKLAYDNIHFDSIKLLCLTLSHISSNQSWIVIANY